MDPFSFSTWRWVVSVHVFSVLMWLGAMMGTLQVLMFHAKQEEPTQRALTGFEKKSAMAMDIGATLTILTGVLLILASPSKPMTHGWMHIKLSLVVLVILGCHGFIRAKIKKFSKGAVKAIPAFLYPVLLVAIAGIVVLAVRQPFK